MNEETPKKRAIRLLEEAYQRQMKGDLDEAVGTVDRPDLDPFYSFLGRIDDAIEECRKAIEVDPTFGNPYNDIGAYLLQKGEIDGAIPWLERALHAPRYESYCYPHMNLGRAFEARRDWLRAREEYRKALAERRDYAPAAQGLARIQGYLN